MCDKVRLAELGEDAMSKGPSQSPPTAAELERQKWLHEQNQRAAERAHDTSKEVALQVNEAAISAGNLALRMSLLICISQNLI